MRDNRVIVETGATSEEARIISRVNGIGSPRNKGINGRNHHEHRESDRDVCGDGNYRNSATRQILVQFQRRNISKQPTTTIVASTCIETEMTFTSL